LGKFGQGELSFAMNDSRYLPEIRNLLRALDDGILDAELHDLFANALSQSISLHVKQRFTMQSFIDLTPAKSQKEEGTLPFSESLSLVETSLSEHYVLDMFSDQSQQQDEFMHEWAAQQSSVDAGNLQEQANANNGIRFDNINIGEKEEGLEDNEEVEEDDNLFRAKMQRKQQQQIASKIRELQQNNVAFKNDDELKLHPAAAKELTEAKIVIAQILKDLHENDALEAAASCLLQTQKLSDYYDLGDFGYLVGQYGSIQLEHLDKLGRMNYHLANEDGQSKRNLDDDVWLDPPNADDENDHFGFGSLNVEKQPSAQKPADEDNEAEEKELYSEHFVESLRAAIQSFESMVKAETEAGRMPNQLIGGILSIEVLNFIFPEHLVLVSNDDSACGGSVSFGLAKA
jgi:hypothetical protein